MVQVLAGRNQQCHYQHHETINSHKERKKETEHFNGICCILSFEFLESKVHTFPHSQFNKSVFNPFCEIHSCGLF